MEGRIVHADIAVLGDDVVLSVGVHADGALLTARTRDVVPVVKSLLEQAECGTLSELARRPLLVWEVREQGTGSEMRLLAEDGSHGDWVAVTEGVR